MAKIQRALLSVTDKTGVVEFARGLSGLGAELISTGGTARLIRDGGVPVKDVAEVTGFPEMLDGRVKTLHPHDRRRHPGHARQRRAHARARGARHPAHRHGGGEPVPLRGGRRAKPGATLEELIENIDIGGPTMIRAAAKNYQDVAVVVSPGRLRRHCGGAAGERRRALARNALAAGEEGLPHHGRLRRRHQRAAGAGGRLAGALPERPRRCARRKLMDLRYGENPHQSAALYGRAGQGIAGAEQLHGKELSYNNLVDLDAAWQLALEFTRARRRPSSSTPIRAAAPSRRRWRRRTARRSSAIRSRRTAA